MRLWIVTLLVSGCVLDFPEGVPPDARPRTDDVDLRQPPVDFAAPLPPVDMSIRPDRPEADPPDAAEPSDAVEPPPAPDRNQPPPPPPPDAAPPPPPPPPGGEFCDGLDNDQDGLVDEGRTCGEYIVEHCTLSLGWADNRGGSAEGAPRWGTCPQQGTFVGQSACTTTAQSPNWGVFVTTGDPIDDEFGVQLACGGGDPQVDRWIQTQCRFRFGYAERIVDEFFTLAFVCNGGPGNDRFGCASTGGDGLFHKLRMRSRMPRGAGFATQWVCQDPGQPSRARSVTNAVEVFFGWAQGTGAELFLLGDGVRDWGACPLANFVDSGQVRCTSTAAAVQGELWGMFAQFLTGRERRYALMWRPR